ncbi:hypothetical protein [Roseovarius aestuariivivens]|uniref:hypothetical protein n=1 Tax=Roseovarius aestuariivivens TaxID=1888910 RepID=UPI001080754E|nr:hypothetical protein [Roseovarius aestuariivivens]
MPNLTRTAALISALTVPALAGAQGVDPAISAPGGYAAFACRLLDQAPVGTVPARTARNLIGLWNDQSAGEIAMPQGVRVPQGPRVTPTRVTPAAQRP